MRNAWRTILRHVLRIARLSWPEYPSTVLAYYLYSENGFVRISTRQYTYLINKAYGYSQLHGSVVMPKWGRYAQFGPKAGQHVLRVEKHICYLNGFVRIAHVSRHIIINNAYSYSQLHGSVVLPKWGRYAQKISEVFRTEPHSY